MQCMHICLWRALRLLQLSVPTLLSILLSIGIICFCVLVLEVNLHEGLQLACALALLVVLPVTLVVGCRSYKVLGIGSRPTFEELLYDEDSDDGNDNVHRVRCVAISDTHSQHWELKVPPGDILLHAGDFSMYGEAEEVADFNAWLGTLPHKHKIVIAGNHDFTFDEDWCEQPENAAFWGKGVGQDLGDHDTREQIRRLLTNCTYIQDELVHVQGLRIYGTPVQPPLPGHSWAFSKEQEDRIAAFQEIPEDLDILLTHGPPYGHCDTTLNGRSYGCQDLLDSIQQVQPRFHVFGHIHDGYGVSEEGETTCINASSCTSLYHPYHDPIVFDVLLSEGRR
eukprot:TRINITY_DN82144_c0_g1_i1.p1 TRINITY_DN82144_c0_g1~~TRINITY_DN82144_c0_g1_i1.p1  ORF type:complete len:338 (-),score=29.56 TRINITY_DN82144_c0_g1_i1:39-1052(-)